MLGAAVMQAASDFVSTNKKLLFTPIFAYLLAFIFFALWLVFAAYLYSIGPVQWRAYSFLADIAMDDRTFYIMWYFLFCLFWVVAFIMSVQKFVVAATAAQWFFDDIADGEKTASVGTSLKWALWYNCGSIAFGSFLIALINLIKVIFEYIDKKYRELDEESPIYKCASCAVRCCIWMLDCCIKWLTENAYIQVALSSNGFCTSAWNAFCLMIRNAGRFSAQTMVDWMLMILGKGFIIALSGFLTYLIIKQGYPNVQNPFIAVGVIIIFAYMSASLFLSIFSFSALSIMHAFLLAEETGKSKDVPEVLKVFLDIPEEQIGNDLGASGSAEAKKTNME